jgi:hypothetical protein
VAIDAADVGVRGDAEGRELGLHHRVAGLAAEGDGLGVLEGLVAAERGHEGEDEREGEEGEEPAAAARVVQIQHRVSGQRGGRVPPPAPLADHAEERHAQAEKHEAREDEVGDDSVVRVIRAPRDLYEKQQDDAEETRDDDDRPGKADVVTQKARGLRLGRGRRLFAC